MPLDTPIRNVFVLDLNDVGHNQHIASDVLDAYLEGRTVLLFNEQTDQLLLDYSLCENVRQVLLKNLCLSKNSGYGVFV